MNEITIPYHLAVPTVICILGLSTILYFRTRLFDKQKMLWISVTVFLAVYLLIVGAATYDDLFYQYDLNRYDLDKDGIFGGQEITKEQEIAMQRLTNDVGRNFSLITGLIFSSIISATTYLFGLIISRIKKNKNHT